MILVKDQNEVVHDDKDSKQDLGQEQEITVFHLKKTYIE